MRDEVGRLEKDVDIGWRGAFERRASCENPKRVLCQDMNTEWLVERTHTLGDEKFSLGKTDPYS